jgi:5-formyltetrahydrofolate cyclo-ligase
MLSEQAKAIFQNNIPLGRDDILAGFHPIGSEVSPLPLLATQTCTICLPVVVEKAKPLIFYKWSVGEPLKKSIFGTKVPAEPVEVIPNIIIVPLLGWDKSGARIGYGGGFYDRTLAELKKQGKILAVGYAFDSQEVPEGIPTESTDVRLDAIVTQTRFIKIS